MVAGQQTERRNHDVAHNVDCFREIEPFRSELVMTRASCSHLFDVSVEAENKITGIRNDTADDAHFHHLLPESNYIIGEVAHHVE